MAFADPDKNVAQFGVFDGMRVADFGSGSGQYAIALGKKVGDSGRVYAVDVQETMLAGLAKNARSHRLSNIEVVRGNFEVPYGSKLSDGTLDMVLFSNVLFQIEDKAGAIKEARRILKQKGKAIVIDWLDSFGGMGPTAGAVVTDVEAKRLFESNGFILSRTIEPGAHHYGLIFSKQ